MFGLAFIRTKNLALPIGIHFAANFVQGTILGFGVSGGESQASLLRAKLSEVSNLLHGGAFGLALKDKLTCEALPLLFYQS